MPSASVSVSYSHVHMGVTSVVWVFVFHVTVSVSSEEWTKKEKRPNPPYYTFAGSKSKYSYRKIIQISPRLCVVVLRRRELSYIQNLPHANRITISKRLAVIDIITIPTLKKILRQLIS